MSLGWTPSGSSTAGSGGGGREAWFQAFCFANIVRGIRQTATKLAIFGVQKASLSMFWEYSPSSANIASDWLRAESSPADEEEIKMYDGVDTSLASKRTGLFVDLWEAQPCLWDPE